MRAAVPAAGGAAVRAAARAVARWRSPSGENPRQAGASVVDLLIVVTIVASIAALAVPPLTASADAADAAAAARHVAGLVARARFEAARRNRAVALRFTTTAAEPTFSLVVDGDGDGVSAADVASGVDAEIRPPDRLSDHFGGARFAVAGSIPAIDGGVLTELDGAIRLGATQQISVAPLGTATSGTVYIASRRGVQYAVRIAGVTGRVRVLRYVPGAVPWRPV
jgi:type II secretory pathway pseudopilin PulG